MQSEDVALFFINGIGDHLLNLPAIRAARRLSGGQLRLVCLEGVARTFFGEFDDLPWCALDVERSESGLEFDVERVARFCAGAKTFLNLNPWMSESTHRLLGELAEARTVGLHAGHQEQRPLDYSKHTSELALDVVRAGLGPANLEDYLGPPRWSRGALDQARGIRSEVPEGQRVLALHGDTGADKMLPDRVWREVLEALCAEDPELTVLLVGKRPLPLDVGPWEAQVVPCYGLPLEVSMALVGLVDGFMGVDSSPLHAADFQGVPSVGVFVSTDPHEFGCICAPHEHVLARDASDAGLPGKIVEAVGRLLGPGGPRGASKARSFQARAFQARALKGRSLKGLGAGQ